MSLYKIDKEITSNKLQLNPKLYLIVFLLSTHKISQKYKKERLNHSNYEVSLPNMFRMCFPTLFSHVKALNP